jgi:hypothetical protein
MPSRSRSFLALSLVGAVAALPLAAGAASAAPDRATTVQTTTVNRYVSDAKAATGALTDFGQDLQNLDSLSEFQGKLKVLRTELRTFDTSIRRLRGYRLANPVINGQRARLARTGPPLAATLSDFLDAVHDNNASEVRGLLPKVTTGLHKFAQAAQIS